MVKVILKIAQSLLTLRVLFVLLTLLLLVAPVSQSWLSAPNQYLYRLGVFLTPAPEVGDDLVFISLPRHEVDRLLHDASGAMVTTRLLDGLNNVFTRGILLVVPEPPYTDNYAADFLLGKLKASDPIRQEIASEGLMSEVKALEKRYGLLDTQIKDGAIFLGILERHEPDGVVQYLKETQKVPVKETGRKDYLHLLPTDWAFPELQLAQFRYESRHLAYPVYSGGDQVLGYPMLWRVGDDHFSDAALVLYKKLLGGKLTEWSKGESVLIDDQVIATSPNGMIYPLYSTTVGEIPDVAHFDVAELKSKEDFKQLHGKTVVIGQKGDASVLDVVYTLQSLQDNAVYITPWWYVWLEKGAILFLALYLLVLLPFLRMNLGILCSLFMLSAIFVVQLGFQITQWQWLPLGLVMLYLVLGHGFMMLWLLQKKSVDLIRDEKESYAIQLAKSFYDHNDWDAALKILDNCRPTEKVLDLTYEIAAGLERKRMYEKSAAVYSGITKRRRNYRDAAKRAKKLASHQKEVTSSLESTMAKTMPVNAGEEKTVIGRYEIDAVLGKGAMGTVYLGHDPKISRQVAIKTLQYDDFVPAEVEEMKRRFGREAEAAGRLDHANIITVYDIGEEADLSYIAMDYVDGQPLSEFTRKGNLLPVTRVYQIVLEVADALGYAHDESIIHRDIKPSNIIFNAGQDTVKIADFGIARIADYAATRTGDVMGSPLYMSPEQIKGEKVDNRTDIFSLGVTFYQLLTGELPFSGDTMSSLSYAIVNKAYTKVTDIRPDLPISASRILNKALNKKPDKRYQTAYEMADELEKCLNRGL